MAHRVGVCGSCRARFQIPSTFTPNRARCRTCGGVVEIGATQSGPQEAPQSAPALAPPPARAEAQAKPEPRPAPAEVQPIRSPVPVEPRAPAPAAARTPPPAPAPVAPAVRPSLARPLPKKRGVLVPALVAAGVLALLIFGAFQLLGRNDSVAASPPTPAAANEDAARSTDPKAQPSAAETIPAPR